MHTARPETDDFQLRIASGADTGALTRLINAAFVVEQVAIPGDRIDAEGTRRFARNGEFLVLENRGGLAGCVYVEKRGERGYLGLLAVDPARQGAGLGRRLVSAAEERLRTLGCVAVDLRMISARSELTAFYERLGYTQTGTSAIPGDVELKIPCHFIHMAKQIS